jgi:16S rRNA (cytosine967-C5)-methyltransferase
MGVEMTINFCKNNNQIAPLTLRVNTLKIDRGHLIEKLCAQGLSSIPTFFSEYGIVLESPPPISDLPFLNEGFYIIQDEASQLVSIILDAKPNECILDACASPGGKTTHLAQMMKNKGEIYALDLNEKRLELIEKNCHRLGVKIVKSVKGDASQPLPISVRTKFDRVLADVPCTGFGTLRKNPDLKWRIKEEDIHRLGELQSSILGNLSSYVKDGGILVYSTCTVFREENEDVIEKFLDEHPQFRLDRIEEVLAKRCHPLIQKGYFKTHPSSHGMDGFFVARMIKIGKDNV